MASDTVSYFVDPRFQARSGAIAATLEQLLEIGGWAATRVDQPASAHITYSPDREVAHGLPAVLPEVWVDSSRAIPVAIDGHLIPSTAIVGADTGGVEFDLVHAAHFFLGGAHEDATDVREPGQDIPGRGVAKWGFLDRPGIAALVASMSAFVAARPGTPAPRARWPAGKSWALALTHDCDRLRRYRVRDFWREARTDVDRREWTRACFDAAKAAYALPLSYVCRDPYENRCVRGWLSNGSWGSDPPSISACGAGPRRARPPATSLTRARTSACRPRRVGFTTRAGRSASTRASWPGRRRPGLRRRPVGSSPATAPAPGAFRALLVAGTGQSGRDAGPCRRRRSSRVRHVLRHEQGPRLPPRHELSIPALRRPDREVFRS